MIILLTKEVKKGDGDGVPVSRDQTWHRERETEESSDEEYHEISPLDWGYISSSLSSLRSNLWWREKWPLYWMLSDADSHSVTPFEWLSDRKTKMIKIPSERFNETQFYFCSVPDCYAEYVVIVLLNKTL